MAKSQESFQKRAREKARQEKKAEKKARREARSSEGGDDLDRADEDALMEQFAKLSQRFEAGEITEQRFSEERHRIFVELGLEQDA